MMNVGAGRHNATLFAGFLHALQAGLRRVSEGAGRVQLISEATFLPSAPPTWRYRYDLCLFFPVG